MTAWEKAGALEVWVEPANFGVMRTFPPFMGPLPDWLPGFTIQKWKAGMLKDLPAPDAPFALQIGGSLSDADLKELARFKNLAGLSLGEADTLRKAMGKKDRELMAQQREKFIKGCKTNGAEEFERIHFWRTPVAKCPSQAAGCVPYYRWVSDYIAVLGGR